MDKKIQQELEILSCNENITILYAAESGSRAWGFPSPDSDYDARFFYVREFNFYLNLFEGRDVIELPIDDALDISGWDIKKALLLASKSNAVVWEWLQSPIVYSEQEGIRERFLEAIRESFSVKSAAHHYLAMAKRGLDTLDEATEIKFKKYFYCIRALLAAHWTLTENAPPPITINELLENISENTIKEIIASLVEEKRHAIESTLRLPNAELNAFLRSLFVRCEEKVTHAPHTKKNKEALNTFYREVLHSLVPQ